MAISYPAVGIPEAIFTCSRGFNRFIGWWSTSSLSQTQEIGRVSGLGEGRLGSGDHRRYILPYIFFHIDIIQ